MAEKLSQEIIDAVTTEMNIILGNMKSGAAKIKAILGHDKFLPYHIIKKIVYIMENGGPSAIQYICQTMDLLASVIDMEAKKKGKKIIVPTINMDQIKKNMKMN